MPVNRILTDTDRRDFQHLIDDMFRIIPNQMSRKIADANVQQAFVLHTTLRIWGMNNQPEINILSVGCFEDTAYEYLCHSPNKGLSIVGIDPAINTSLESYVTRERPFQKFDVVFATSVIEHVKDDESFLRDMCVVLKDGGYGILTTDFKDDYKKGEPLPYSDERFYTRHDLEVRLRSILKQMGCDLVDEPDYTQKDRFIYQGHHYSFATFVFRKTLNNVQSSDLL